MKPQKYNPALGLQGNIEKTLWENQYRKNEINNNKYDADNKFSENESTFCEVAEVASDSTDALTELAEMVADLLTRIEALEGKVNG